MKVFITGASGWIGSGVVEELRAAGHDVVGLARSDDSASALDSVGVHAHRGSLDDLDSIRAGADDSDAVIHLAFKHDFADSAGAARTERSVVAAIGDTLAGSDRPFLIASGVGVLDVDGVATESDAAPDGPEAPRGGSERLALDYADRGVQAVGLRFAPTVHGDGDEGFVAALVQAARSRGTSGYVGDGSNRWPAVHRDDAARAVRLALEAPAGAIAHIVAEEGIPTRRIAEVIGRKLDLPVESVEPADAKDYFGWIGAFFSMDLPASSTATRHMLGWTPRGPGLLDDLEAGYYFRSA